MKDIGSKIMDAAIVLFAVTMVLCVISVFVRLAIMVWLK